MRRMIIVATLLAGSALAAYALGLIRISDDLNRNADLEQSPRKRVQTPAYDNADTCLTLNEVVDPVQELRQSIGALAPRVSVEDEMEVGDAVHERRLEEERVTEAPAEVQSIFERMVSVLESRHAVAGFDYKLHYLPESEVVNAFTIGGHVYLTQGMMDYIETDDELACVFGHELYHNELGHINAQIAEYSAAMGIGAFFGVDEDLMSTLVSSSKFLEGLLFPSFNQENELMCDLHGIDLAEEAGYDGCAARNFWLRMEDSREFDFERLLSTHPGGDDRAECIHHHIDHYYNLPCN